MQKLRSINLNKMDRERVKREYDLRVLNRVSESEYESRMVVWNHLTATIATVNESKSFIDATFAKLQQDLTDTRRDLAINYNEFVTIASEEINYIKVFVNDNTTQYMWYAAIALMIAGTIALCI